MNNTDPFNYAMSGIKHFSTYYTDIRNRCVIEGKNARDAGVRSDEISLACTYAEGFMRRSWIEGYNQRDTELSLDNE